MTDPTKPKVSINYDSETGAVSINPTCINIADKSVMLTVEFVTKDTDLNCRVSFEQSAWRSVVTPIGSTLAANTYCGFSVNAPESSVEANYMITITPPEHSTTENGFSGKPFNATPTLSLTVKSEAADTPA